MGKATFDKITVTNSWVVPSHNEALSWTAWGAGGPSSSVAADYAEHMGIIGSLAYMSSGNVIYSHQGLGQPAFPALPVDMPETGIQVMVNGIEYTVTKAQLAAVHIGDPIPPGWKLTKDVMALPNHKMKASDYVNVASAIDPYASVKADATYFGEHAKQFANNGPHPAFKHNASTLLNWLNTQPDLALAAHPEGGWQVFSLKHAKQGDHRNCPGPTPYHALALAFHYEFPCDGGYYSMVNDLKEGGVF